MRRIIEKTIQFSIIIETNTKYLQENYVLFSNIYQCY